MLNKLFKSLVRQSENTTKKESTMNTTKKWTCDFCGATNYDYEFECQDCGHERED